MKGNGKLNLIFVAELFNLHPCLTITEEDEAQVLAELDIPREGTREERVFRLWVNSLEIPELFIDNLYEDVQSGWALLQVLEKIFPHTVDFKRVTQHPRTVFKRLENCGVAVETCRKNGIELHALEGRNISDGEQTFVLAIFDKLYRAHIQNMLKRGGKRPDEKDIVRWANNKVKEAGFDRQIKDFRDKSLADGVFLSQLLSSVRRSAIDFDQITPGSTDEEQMANAEYIINVARKIGCTIFNIPDDITEVNPKMTMILVSMIMLVDAQ